MNEVIQTIAVYALPLLFAITLHEAAHAYAARYFGDSTAYSQGRMSLNPTRHIDPFGTILMPILLYVATAGNFIFGYAKPVPVDFGKLRKPKRDMAWVALAGPAANFAMALMWLVFWLVLSAMHVREPFFMEMAGAGVDTNLLLLAFNLFPVPPLDGGRVLTSMLPHKYSWRFAQIEPYGFFIVMALILLKVIYLWVMPIKAAAGAALAVLVFPLKFLLH